MIKVFSVVSIHSCPGQQIGLGNSGGLSIYVINLIYFLIKKKQKVFLICKKHKHCNFAFSNKNLKLIKYLIKSGAKLGLKDRLGRTSLHWAAEKGDLAIAKFLLYKGIAINLKDNDGETVLHEVAKWGHLELAQLFINHGANINAIGSDGRAPIHIAIATGNIEIVNLFKTYGADFSLF